MFVVRMAMPRPDVVRPVSQDVLHETCLIGLGIATD
jgi:hypothetical protein